MREAGLSSEVVLPHRDEAGGSVERQSRQPGVCPDQRRAAVPRGSNRGRQDLPADAGPLTRRRDGHAAQPPRRRLSRISVGARPGVGKDRRAANEDLAVPGADVYRVAVAVEHRGGRRLARSQHRVAQRQDLLETGEPDDKAHPTHRSHHATADVSVNDAT